MFDGFAGRSRFIGELLRQKVYGRIFAALAFAYTLFSAWRDELATPKQQETFRAITLLPHWPVIWWVGICLLMVALWIFEAAYKLQKPGMNLIFDDVPRSMASGDGPMQYIINVGLRNGSDKRLNNCRIQLDIVSHDGIPRPRLVRFPVCAPFSLSPDESHYVPILSYEFDVREAPLQVPQFHRVEDKWIRERGEMILLPGQHDVIVEALSDDSRIARLKLKIENKDDRWWVNGESTGAG
jgi:hypothetical protein